MIKKIIGVTVGSSLPKPNFEQTDPTRGDYIKNKPDFDGLKSKVEQIEVRVDTMQESAYDDTELRGIVSENVAKIDTLNELVGNTKVETQISDAVATLESEISDKLDTMQSAIDSKVDAEDGKGLSTNDYTDEEQQKLRDIESGANYYEHPTHSSHDLGLYKVTVDDEGHVSGATAVEKEDILAFVEKDDIVNLGFMDEDSVSSEISDLNDRIDGVEGALNTTNGTLNGLSEDFEDYKTTNNEAVATNASGIEANKTAIEEIQGDYLTSTDRTHLQDGIDEVSEKATANASAIAILNGEGDGSVKQSIDNAFNEFATNVTNDETINTYKELIDYAAKHGPEFAELVGKVKAINDSMSEAAKNLDSYKEDVSNQFTAVYEAIDEHDDNRENPHGVTKEQIGLGNVDNTADMDKPVSNPMQEALELKSDKGHNHDDLYYDKDETLGLITVEDINDICALTLDPGSSVDPVMAATKYWVESYFQQKGDYLTAPDIDAHNVSTSSHSDIRLLIENVAKDLYTLADCDDETLDQMHEVVDYMQNNKSLIDGITTNKVNVSDIVNNLTTNAGNKPLSAAQGVILKALIDAIVIPTKVSDLANDSGYLVSYTETDPTVPAWAKAESKPTYTAEEVGALPASTVIPTIPTNVSAFKNDTGYLTKIPEGYATETFVKNKIAEAELGGEEVDLSGYATKEDIPTKTSDLINNSGFLTEISMHDYAQPIGDYALKSEIPTDYLTSIPKEYITESELDAKGYLTSYTETDPTVPAWAKASTKPTYTASEVGALPNTTKIPNALSDLTGDSTHRLVTDSEKTSWNAKADISDIPTNVSQLTNDKNYLTSYTETDPTVPSWAKQSTKPSYTKSEVGLGNVDNTSDANKPVSTAQANAIADAKKAGTDAQANLTTHTSNKSNPHSVTKAQVGLGNVDNVKQYSADNPPPYPVTSVNGKTGAVTVSAVPSCAASNNGQFLRVVNGVAAWSTVPNAEEASF